MGGGSSQGEEQVIKSQIKMWLAVLDTAIRKRNHVKIVNNQHVSVFTFHLFTADQRYFKASSQKKEKEKHHHQQQNPTTIYESVLEKYKVHNLSNHK